ncbi:MAG TPA: hypothetical protein VI318_20420 [Baekduia sp.]
MTPSSTISLLSATAEHDTALRQLSQLDSARTIRRPALMAVVDDRLVAAISTEDGRVVADPFVPTEDAVHLLRVRTAELRAERLRHAGRRRLPRLGGLRPRVAA